MGRTCVFALSRFSRSRHPRVNRLLVAAVLHVDEVADDETADVAQTELTRDLVCRLQIGLQNRLLDVRATLVTPGVHVHCDERFGFVDHDVAAAWQPDLAMKGVVDLFLDAEGFENRRRAVIKLDPAFGASGNLADHIHHTFDRGVIVTDHFVDFIGQKIAHRPLDQIRLLEDARRGGLVP